MKKIEKTPLSQKPGPPLVNPLSQRNLPPDFDPLWGKVKLANNDPKKGKKGSFLPILDDFRVFLKTRHF